MKGGPEKDGSADTKRYEDRRKQLDIKLNTKTVKHKQETGAFLLINDTKQK
jgi:hypothetical protein